VRDLFDQDPNSLSDKILTERHVFIHEVNHEYVYEILKNVSYQEYLKVRLKTIEQAVSANLIKNSEAARQKFWERLMDKLEEKFKYKRPKSYERPAELMRRKRGGV
jgi:hypothetical protein